MEPLSTTNFLPRPCWDLITAGKNQLFQQRRVAQCFKQICSAICTFRVFAEAPAVFCQKQSVEKTLGRGQSEGNYRILQVRSCTFHPKPVSVNSNSYDNFIILTMLLNSNNFKQRQMHAAEKKPSIIIFQPFLSARHCWKSAFFKRSHLALRTFCHAPAGIWLQPVKTNSSSSGEWLNASSKSAAPSAPFVSLLKHLQCFVRNNLSKRHWDEDKVKVITGYYRYVHVRSILNPSRSTPTHMTTSSFWRCS